MTDAPHPRRHYGRRKGWKLGPHQKSLMETLLPRLTLAPQRGLDPRKYFAAPVSDVWLEVGFGGGEHLFWQAEHNPGIGMVGAEPFVAGMAKLLAKISLATTGGEGVEGRGPGNILIYPEDATDVIEALPDACLGRIFVLFPDPWPKTRHHKRRFLQMEMLDRLARVMREGAELRFATDDRGYLVWALERLMAHPDFAWTAQSPAGWHTRPSDWPPTRYEEKALHGRPHYLAFVRTGR